MLSQLYGSNDNNNVQNDSFRHCYSLRSRVHWTCFVLISNEYTNAMIISKLPERLFIWLLILPLLVLLRIVFTNGMIWLDRHIDQSELDNDSVGDDEWLDSGPEGLMLVSLDSDGLSGGGGRLRLECWGSWYSSEPKRAAAAISGYDQWLGMWPCNWSDKRQTMN